MKITQEDYNTLEAAIKPLCEQRAAMREYVNEERFRWDMLFAANQAGKVNIMHLYSYLNDATIDTALRRIVGSR